MVERFLIFSDETGHWNEGDFYIRSWIILSEEEYSKLREKISLFKKIHNIKGELKFKRGHDYSLFSEIDFKIYFTITFCNDFNDRSFNLLDEINQKESIIINSRDIKSKILNTLKNSLFLNIYEFFHIKNSVSFMQQAFEGKDLIFFIDSPQYQNKDWREIFQEVCDSQFKCIIINDSGKEIGLQFADILAGNLKKILADLDDLLSGRKNLNVFEKKIAQNFSQGNGTNMAFMNTPNIIMWKEEHQEFVDKLVRLMDIVN